MRQELLLEFFSEEIPARFQKKAISDSKEVFLKILTDYGAIFSDIETYVSPRRIAIRVLQLADRTKDTREEKRGPKVSAPQNAVEGFLKANKKQTADLFEKDGYYHLNIDTEGQNITDIIGEIIEEFIAKMPWQKSMKWYVEEEKALSAFWVRPLRSILCVFGEKAISTYIKSVGITTGNYTFGHRFLAPGKITVSSFSDYMDKLEKNYVILDFFKKREYIDKEMTQKAASMGLHIGVDETLLDEVTGLVEYPFVHIGAIEEKFMSLPSIVLSTSMKVHQKYFTLMYPGDVVAPFFATVTNVPGTDLMHEGLERVLRARLSDAMFFYKEDTDATLEAFAQRLSNVAFHEKLGSIAQKVDRMMSIANTREEHRVIALCKADLMSQMVGEFPELQGIMGEIYAKVQGEEPEVSQAIREHYKPVGANDKLPITKTGARVAFFDKLDTLVGFLGVGIYPTGSKDPFALRRAALCIVRLLCDFGEDLLDGENLTWYIETLMTSYSDQGVALEQETVIEVEKFVVERLKVYMSDRLDIPADIVESIISSFKGLDFDYKLAISKAQKLYKLSQLDSFQIVKEAYKRATGVVGDSDVEEGALEPFANPDMQRLKEDVENLQQSDKENFELFVKASKSVLTAGDNVLINDTDEGIKTRNLRLLKTYTNLIRTNIGNI